MTTEMTRWTYSSAWS